MNAIKPTTKRCIYCMQDHEVVNFSVRTIPGYRNNLTGKDTAFVEKLACGHEYVDGKFNVDNLYFSAPRSYEYRESDSPGCPVNITPIPRRNYKRKSHGGMDGACMVSMVILGFLCPPLLIVPALYFWGRLK
jgi:hypothetical protein